METTKVVIPGKEISESLSEGLKQKIAALQPGEVLCTYIRNVSTDDNKIQAEFAEKINLSTRQQSALAMFNPGDDRFSSGARRAWLTMDRAHAHSMFGVKIKDDAGFAEVGKILEPLKDSNGHPTADLRITVLEKLESQMTESEKEYPDNYIKTIPSTGAFFYAKSNGERVASNTDLRIIQRVKSPDGTLVKGEVQHVLIEGEYRVQGAASVLNTAGNQVNKDFVS